MSANRTTRIARALFGLNALLSVAAALAGLTWALATIRARPLDGVEGEVIFEAMRLSEKRALYIDPLLGDPTTGAPPTRYFVLYPPLFPAFLSLFSFEKVASYTLFTRALSTTGWLSAVAIAALPREKSRRAIAACAAAFVLGIYVLDLFATAGRPDALALLLATLALSRSVKRGNIDAIAGALFALAAFTKPNVIGLGAGVVLASLVRHKRAALPGIGVLALTAFAIGCILQVASKGLFLSHLLTSTAQATSLVLWRDQMASRMPFFLSPLVLAFFVGVKSRKDDSTYLALAALTVSFGWAVLSLAKIGGASNYLIEPCLAALVIVARTPSIDLGKWNVAALAILLFQIVHNGVATVRSSLFEGIPSAREARAALDEIRASCIQNRDDVAIADEPGIELEIDGRVVSTPFQFSHYGKTHPEFLRAWESDAQDPHVRCLVVQNDLLEHETDDDAHDRFSRPMKDVLRARFALEKTEGGFEIYRPH